MKIWMRVGMEVDLTKEEMDSLQEAYGTKEGERDYRKAEHMLHDLIERGKVSGETYILGKENGGVENYDNPEKEISILL